MSDRVLSFSFKYVTKTKINSVIHKFDSQIPCQESDMSVKVIQENNIKLCSQQFQ